MTTVLSWNSSSGLVSYSIGIEERMGEMSCLSGRMSGREND